MINQVYRLIAPNVIKVCFENRSLDGEGILVRPTKLSICAADQRYYTGSRGVEILKKKLPMALIHEGAGVVVHDPKGEFKSGDKVVMIPNTPTQADNCVAENYLTSSKFRASGFDGFMQDCVVLQRDRVVKYENINDDIASFTELISVAMHAISRFEKKSFERKDTIGVWGDGNLGFITSLLLKTIYPESKIIAFGKNAEKLTFFTFADETYTIDAIPSNVRVDHAFEAVGGKGCKSAIEQIIDIINPEGTVSLMGVSEDYVEINTRMVLERGLTLFGSSRSGREDFEKSVAILEANPYIQEHLVKLISAVIDVKSVNDIHKAFKYDLSTSFKTVMNWMI